MCSWTAAWRRSRISAISRIECDGHDVDDLKRAFEEARAYTEGPSVLLAHTIKGKGVSFMEGQAAWHGKAPDDEQLAQALAEIDGEV